MKLTKIDRALLQQAAPYLPHCCGCGKLLGIDVPIEYFAGLDRYPMGSCQVCNDKRRVYGTIR
jgi:hypothetical protein